MMAAIPKKVRSRTVSTRLKPCLWASASCLSSMISEMGFRRNRGWAMRCIYLAGKIEKKETAEQANYLHFRSDHWITDKNQLFIKAMSSDTGHQLTTFVQQ